MSDDNCDAATACCSRIPLKRVLPYSTELRLVGQTIQAHIIYVELCNHIPFSSQVFIWYCIYIEVYSTLLVSEMISGSLAFISESTV